MVRKSDRNKPKSSEKSEPTDKGSARKVGRPPKRRKKSESDAESEVAEPEPPQQKEVCEIVPAEPKQQQQLQQPVSSDGEKGNSRRSTRRHPNANTSEAVAVTTPPPPPEPETKPEKNPEWKEEPGFWGPEDSAPAADAAKSEEATTWKIQSTNGSGGEIQKLKICRQRVANDSNDSSSPAQTKDSPRRKKKHKHGDENAESGGDVSSSNETKEEAKSEKTSTHSSDVKPLENTRNSESTEQQQEAEVGAASEEVLEVSVIEMDKIPMPGEDIADDKVAVKEVDVETSSRRASQEDNERGGNKSRKSSVDEKVVQTKSRKPSVEEGEKESKSRKSSVEEDVAQHDDAETISAVESIIGVVIGKDDTKEEEKKEHPRVRTKSETSEDGKGDKKSLSKVKVTNSEDAINEIAKKLNERAARFSKDAVKEERKQLRVSRESTESHEPRSPREEGELSPPHEHARKFKHTTIIINKPKEVASQPTRLKRTLDELAPSERKRRILLKPKPKVKDEDPINISSQSLMLLVPEVKTITPEQVAAFALDDEELSRFEMSDHSEETSPRLIKKKIDLEPKEVEIRVENDTRQVTKKKHIVIETKDNSIDSKSVGPKLPSENHRVVRKISIVTEDVKKSRRSPSPGTKSQTEVLFITNLVRPFTVPQLRELLARTGTIAPNGFYIDKIKSKCYVKYTDVEMAVETRHALNGVRWPVNNPKTLKVEFVPPDEMTVVQQVADDDTSTKKVESSDPGGWLSEQAALKPQRRVTTAVREWDMGKIGAGPLDEKRPGDDWRGTGGGGGGVKQQEQLPVDPKRRPASPVEAKYEPSARKVKKRDNDAPARLLDDLFRKTKATPCIYWLPLTAAQIAVKEEMRRQHMAENERRLAELRKTDHSRRENRDRDREKSRDRRKK